MAWVRSLAWELPHDQRKQPQQPWGSHVSEALGAEDVLLSPHLPCFSSEVFGNLKLMRGGFP